MPYSIKIKIVIRLIIYAQFVSLIGKLYFLFGFIGYSIYNINNDKYL